MSGHSKWATIKHKKGAADKARGKLFNKIARQLEVAAREGGPDTNSNATLRTVIQKAKAAQMTNDAIDRAAKRDFNGTELRAFAGNFLYSTGANENAGRFTAGHFDLPMRNHTVMLDGDVVGRGRRGDDHALDRAGLSHTLDHTLEHRRTADVREDLAREAGRPDASLDDCDDHARSAWS